MGKRAHGRLLHEIRTTLIGKGFCPKRATFLMQHDGDQPREIYSAGFKLARHRDNKSISLSHWANANTLRAGRHAGRLHEAKRIELHKYHEALTAAGFILFTCHCNDPREPFSLWRRDPPSVRETQPSNNCAFENHLEPCSRMAS